MKKLFIIVAALFVAVSFSSCDKDEEKNLPVTNASLAGTWQITHSEGWETFNDGFRQDYSDTYPLVSDGNYYWTYTFDENGTCVEDYHNTDSDHADEYTYFISGNVLTMTGKTDSDLNFVVTIKKLTSSQLILFSSETFGDGNSLSATENTSTYKRL